MAASPPPPRSKILISSFPRIVTDSVQFIPLISYEEASLSGGFGAPSSSGRDSQQLPGFPFSAPLFRVMFSRAEGREGGGNIHEYLLLTSRTKRSCLNIADELGLHSKTTRIKFF